MKKKTIGLLTVLLVVLVGIATAVPNQNETSTTPSEIIVVNDDILIAEDAGGYCYCCRIERGMEICQTMKSWRCHQSGGYCK